MEIHLHLEVLRHLRATNPTNNPELAGGETVGAVGYGYYMRPELLVSLGVNYDNNNALLFGLELYGRLEVKKHNPKIR